jgi:hypothetical protein
VLNCLIIQIIFALRIHITAIPTDTSRTSIKMDAATTNDNLAGTGAGHSNDNGNGNAVIVSEITPEEIVRLTANLRFVEAYNRLAGDGTKKLVPELAKLFPKRKLVVT